MLTNIIYFSLLLFPMLSLVRMGEDRLNKSIAIMSIVLFCFVFSFRFDVAPDYTNYYSIYHSLIDGGGRYYNHVVAKTEPLFLLLNSALIYFGFPYQVLVIIITTYISVLAILLLNRCKGHYILCWLVMFPLLMSSLNIMRQAIAIFTLLWASKYLLNGERKKFLLTILLCSFVHYTALVCLSFFFLVKVKRVSLYLSVFFVLSFLTYLVFKSFGGISLIFRLMSVPEVYQAYLDYPYEENAGFGIRVWLELAYVMFFIALAYKRDFSKNIVFYNFIFCIGILLNFAFLEVPILSRLANYFYFFSILAIPSLLTELKFNYFKFTVVCLISLYFSMVSYRVISSENYRPYQFILFFNDHTPQPK